MKPELVTQPDIIFQMAYDAIRAGSISTAAAALDLGRREAPLDCRFAILASALVNSQGNRREALGFLWSALAAEPNHPLAEEELKRLAVTQLTDPKQVQKDYSLLSGERQTASSLLDIRADHRARYALVARYLRRRAPPAWSMTGIDAFCGNGYGSHMLATSAGAHMIGIDGCLEAVELASRVYGSHRVKFMHGVFPFELSEGLFDFAVSFESLEHVANPELLLEQLAHATSGPVCVSVPNELALPFAKFGHRFEHHIRHFEKGEILKLLERVGRSRIMAEFGQQVYRVEGGDIAGLLPEAEMGLRSYDQQRSQFLVIIADRV
jgi:2-polyprenyl-3-methyl-5-hydroxy-6-metoxy-1,4-benzoquinol methylase